MKYWIFQAVPERYDLSKALASLQSDEWLVTRYAADMSQGDVIYYWQAGRTAALHAWGIIKTGKVFTDADDDNRIETSYQVQLIPPIPKAELVSHTALQDLQVFRAPQGTNFKVSLKEATALNSLIKLKGFKAPPDPIEIKGGGER